MNLKACAVDTERATKENVGVNVDGREKRVTFKTKKDPAECLTVRIPTESASMTLPSIL